MQHTIISLGNSRLIIKPNALEAGIVTVVICDRMGEPIADVSLDCSSATVAASALENVASECFECTKKTPLNIGKDWHSVNEIARGAV